MPAGYPEASADPAGIDSSTPVPRRRSVAVNDVAHDDADGELSSATRARWSGGVATRPTVTTPRSAPLSGACPVLCASSVIGQLPGMFRGHGERESAHIAPPEPPPGDFRQAVARPVHDHTGLARSASTGWCRSRAASY